MKRYLLCVLAVFLGETLLLALLSDRPSLTPYLPQDRTLSIAFWLAWPLALLVRFLLRSRSSATRKPAAKRKSSSPQKRRKKSPLPR